MPRPARQREPHRSVVRLPGPLSPELSLWSGIMLTAVVLLARRWSDGFRPPDSPGLSCLLATATAVLGLTVFRRQAAWRLRSRRFANPEVAAACRTAAFVAPPLFVGLAVLPNQSPLGIAYLLGLTLLQTVWLMGLEAVSANLPRRNQTDSRATAAKNCLACESLVEPAVAIDPPTESASRSSPAGPEEASDSRPSPSMHRSRLPDGGEAIQGEMTAQFLAGQKVVQLHVPFWPALPNIPQVECEAYSEEGEVRVKVAAVHTFGMRIELRRSGNVHQPVECWVEFAGECQPSDLSDAA